MSTNFLLHLRSSHVCEDVLKEEPSEDLQCDVPGCSYSTQKSYNMLGGGGNERISAKKIFVLEKLGHWA